MTSSRNEVKRYGWFHCKDCGRVWESAHVLVSKYTGFSYYGQQCKKCRGAYILPCRVATIKCPSCTANNRLVRRVYVCICFDRRLDLDKPHRADLCERCTTRCDDYYYDSEEGSGDSGDNFEWIWPGVAILAFCFGLVILMKVENTMQRSLHAQR